MENDDIPKDLTFRDPAISTRPLNYWSTPPKPKGEPVSTTLGKLRDLVIGLLLLVGFFAAMWGLSLLITGARGK